jgi:hypothetical protein
MDERGLVELDDSVPKQAKIDGQSAVIEAREMTTRKINAELRWLIYEEGVTDVTVRDPSARHSLGGVATWSSRATSARAPGSIRRAAPSSCSATRPR